MESQEVTVSAIITTHNRCDLVKRAIDSALGQSVELKEVIVVDDASTDGTQAVVSAIPDVNYIRIDAKDSNGGNHARNLGLMVAKGKYVAFLDDDDYWTQDKLASQVAVAERSEAGVVLCGMTREIIGDDGDIKFVDDIDNRHSDIWPRNMSHEIFCAIPSVTSCVLFKRDTLLEIGGFDESLTSWQEYELLIRLAQITRFSYVPRSQVIYRQSASDKHRISNKYFSWIDSVRRIESKHHKLISGLPIRCRISFAIVKLTDAVGRARDAGMPIRSAFMQAENIILRTIRKALTTFQK